MKLIWFVNYDHLDDKEIAIGNDYNRGGDLDVDAVKAFIENGSGPYKGCGLVKFRLYDDDGELYYSGFYNGINGSEAVAFLPLDWGMGYAGCAEMKVLEKGKWSIL